MTTQFNVRLPDITVSEIKHLSHIYGSQSKAIIAAVSKLAAEIKELEMNYQVIEDGGGSVYLFVFAEDGQVIHGIGNLEYAQPGELDNLDVTDVAGWEGHLDDPQDGYDSLTGFPFGWQVIADQNGRYPERMGRAGQILFQVEGD